ncbi:hypothetical protein HA520_01050 [Azotobacter chroococcum]|uniref:Uncharacterized protein n=1 Tax=Azotobacter chroococcum TaxID=353 RepID=A0AA43Z3P4_9GAMM|nr:hypothetical protein [Azotobacter chroococcum]NHN75882.1 hypothetical protein [Azotobacter chroococcum]
MPLSIAKLAMHKESLSNDIKLRMKIRKELKALEWLTTDQALTALEDMGCTKVDKSYLVDHCQHGNCEVYILADGQRGQCIDAIPYGKDEWTYECYGIGYQKILSPDKLLAPSLAKLILTGTVRNDDRPEPEVFDYIDWEIEALPRSLKLYYKIDQIESLGIKIISSGKSGTLDPRERKSAGQIIAVLAAMAGVDRSKPYAAVAALQAAAATEGIPFDLSPETIVKYLEMPDK